MQRSRFLATLVAVTMIFATTEAVSAPATRATGSSCPNYVFVGARGSGEDYPETAKTYSAPDHGLGRILDSVYEPLKKAAAADGKTVVAYGVRYPAVALNKVPGDYVRAVAEMYSLSPSFDASVKVGAEDTAKEVRRVHSSCSTARFIMAGYSQGAQAVSKAVVETLTPAEKKLIVASVYFGDTRFNANDSAADYSNFQPDHYGYLGPRADWSAILSSPVFDYCHDGDPVCGLLKKVGSAFGLSAYVRDVGNVVAHVVADNHPTDLFYEHENYPERGDTAEAALKIERVLGIQVKSTSTLPSDTVFVIDSTGSMGDEIDQVRENVDELARTIASSSSNYRFALVDYKDDPADDSAYQARVDVPFTRSTSAFAAGVGALEAEGGGDTPESMYSGIMTALNLPWRAGVRKTVIVIGDAPGKDPEPVTGYTLGQVTAKALSVDPAEVYTVPVGVDSSTTDFMSAVSSATGGAVTQAADTSDALSSLTSSIVKAGTAPSAELGVEGTTYTGTKSTFSAAGSLSDPSDPIVGYDWNFGTGTPKGSYDARTTSPRASRTYVKAGTYTVSLRVRAASGLTGLATAKLTVRKRPATGPAAVSGLTATPGDGTATLTWRSSRRADYYVVKDSTSGKVVAAFTSRTAPASAQKWEVTGLANGLPRSFQVFAVNVAGVSKGRSVTVTPRRAVTVESIVHTSKLRKGHKVVVGLSTKSKGDLLLAFLSENGPASREQLSATPHSSGLRWTLVQKATSRSAYVGIWRAHSDKKLKAATVSMTVRGNNRQAQFSVVAFAPGALVGRVAKRSSTHGAASLGIHARGASQVWAVGRASTSSNTLTPSSGQHAVAAATNSKRRSASWLEYVGVARDSTLRIGLRKPTSSTWTLAGAEVYEGRQAGKSLSPAVDGAASSGQRSKHGVVTVRLTTKAAGDLLVAFVAGAGRGASSTTAAAPRSKGITWKLVERTTSSAGAVAVWQAHSPKRLVRSSVTVRSPGAKTKTLLDVVAFRHGAVVADHRTGHGRRSAAHLSIRAPKNSLVWSVGEGSATGALSARGGEKIVAQVASKSGKVYAWVEKGSVTSVARTVTAGLSRPVSGTWLMGSIAIEAK